MPIFDIPVREFPQHVLSPLVRQYTDRLIREFGLSDLIGNNIYIKYGFGANIKTKDYYKNIQIKTNRVDVEVEVNMDPDNQKWDYVNFKFNPGYGFPLQQLAMDRPLFQDPEVGVGLYLHEVPCTVTMNITFTLLNKTTAYMLQSSHYELHGFENSPEYGDFMYDLPVNKGVLGRLHGVYKLRRLDPKQVSFPGYLFAGSITKIGYRVNRTNTNTEFVIRQHKTQMLEDVSIGNTKPQEVQEAEGTVLYTVPFTYTVQFARPAFYTLMYPISIMNKLLPHQYLDHPQEIRDNIRNVDFVKSQLDKTTYNYLLNVYKKYAPVFVSPVYEDWREPSSTPAKQMTQRPFWIITVLLDEDDQGRIIIPTKVNMSGVIVADNTKGGYRLHPIVEEIIGIQGCESFEDDCIFNISVFRTHEEGTELLYINDIDWDIDDRAILINSKERGHRFHVVISEMIDFNFLNPKWYFLLERYKDFFKDPQGSGSLDNINTLDILEKQDWESYGDYTSFRVLYSELIPRKFDYIPQRVSDREQEGIVLSDKFGLPTSPISEG